MAYGQSFYTYSGGYQPNGYNNYVAPQMPNYNYYNGQQQMPQNPQNQPVNGYQQQQGQMAQPQQVQPTQPQQPMPNPIPQGFPIREIRFVTSDEAKAFIVMPNSNALLLDTVNGMAYLKTADNLGQSVTEYFKFTKVNADGSPIQNPNQLEELKNTKTAVHEEIKAQPIDTKDFIKKEDIKGFITTDEFKSFSSQLGSQFKSLSEQLESLQKKLNAKLAKADKTDKKEIDNAE